MWVVRGLLLYSFNGRLRSLLVAAKSPTPAVTKPTLFQEREREREMKDVFGVAFGVSVLGTECHRRKES